MPQTPTSQQQAVICQTDGPHLVIAGPGSGKSGRPFAPPRFPRGGRVTRKIGLQRVYIKREQLSTK